MNPSVHKTALIKSSWKRGARICGVHAVDPAASHSAMGRLIKPQALNRSVSLLKQPVSITYAVANKLTNIPIAMVRTIYCEPQDMS